MIRRIFLLFLFVACIGDSFGASYFVGGSGASDNNPGTATQPFATIQKAASVAVAGDIVNIRSGTYRETIVAASSGPITYQPDGNSNVIISGLNTTDGGWSVHSGNIYKKSITLPVNGYNSASSNNTTLLANQIFKDGVMMFEARWPDLDVPADLVDRAKVRKITSATATTITDTGIPPNVVGATMWINGWYLSRTGKITAQSGSTITFSPSTDREMERKFFYLTGKLSLLSAAKEWHYENGTLYFWQPGGGAPTGVEYKARNYGFDVRGKSNITIKGIQFFGCDPVVGSSTSSNILVDGIKAKYLNHGVIVQPTSESGVSGSMATSYWNARQVGIKLIGPNNVIKNSEIEFAIQGIWLGEQGRVENNKISNIGYEGNYGAGVIFWSGNASNQVVTRNTIFRTGRSAVDFGWVISDRKANIDISYNDFSDYGRLNIDVGGTYAGGYKQTDGTRVHHNWIHDSGAIFGDGVNAAIYWDMGSGPSTVDHNVCWNNVGNDIFTNVCHGGSVNPVSYYYNNVFASKYTEYAQSYKSPCKTPVDVQLNNIYRDDIMVALGTVVPNVANSLFMNVDPQFVGTGQGGLAYRIKSTSPGVNKGIAIPGITDGSAGLPEIGAYEIGGTEWVPGYKPVTNTSNTPPVGSITSPANGTSFTQGSAITITANASDADGTITRVEFFRGTTKVGEDLSSPYSFVMDNAPLGTHVLTVKVTDNNNSTTTSASVTITIGSDTAPTVTLTSPANAAQFAAGATVTITATAADPNGSVTKIEFFNGTTKVGEDLTAPYSFDWNNAPAGTHTLTAKATDNAGNVTTSAPVTISISANSNPEVLITSPGDNAQFVTGTPITITASASDANGSITRVEFFRGTTKLGEDLTSPYSFVWNNAPVGVYSITAKATDNGSNVATSAAVSISVSTNPPPSVLITGPSNNKQFTAGTRVSITATASDANGAITKVEFFNGTTKLGEDATSPYNFDWTNPPKGSHTLIAKATDNQASSASSPAVIINVIDANVPPTISITSPSSNAQFITGSSITIAASAADANGSVTKVEFFQGTTKLGEDATSPYSFVWTNVPAGNYSLSAKALDNQNASATSASVPIIVNTPPTITFQSPANNASFNAGSTITFTALATDANGTIKSVEFFNGTTKLGQDLTNPYTFAWANVPAGSYSITAKATDNQNAVSTTLPLNISVVNSPVPPLNNTNPTANAGEDVTLSLPENSLTLHALDIPEEQPLLFTWTQLSGPSTISISNPTSQDTEITGLIEGIYVIELTVEDNTTGLSSKDEVQIHVVSDFSTQNLQSAIPRFFSPNDDGKGDFWEWKNVDQFENSVLTVFNRSGQKIYEAISYKNTWNGKVGNTPLQAGDYYYIVKLINNSLIRGALQIIR